MKNKCLKIQFFIFTHIVFLLLLSVGCNMKKDWDVDFLAFPPKLSVTAILDSENGLFDISLMEGRSLADYAQLFQINQENIRNGEIRLFEDGILILSIQGPFDMTYYRGNPPLFEYQTRKNGYRHISTGMNLNPGSVYRLEADVEGYPMAASTATVPVAPVISASMDISTLIFKNNVRAIYPLGYGEQDFVWNRNLPKRYWPVSIQITDPDPDVFNYFALDILKQELTFTGNTLSGATSYNWGIGASDESMLQDIGFEVLLDNREPDDLYLFSLLQTNDVVFSPENTSRTFYAAVTEILNNQKDDESHFENDPNFEKITTRHSLSLRVTHIPPAVYRFYRSLTQNGTGWFTEPVPVASNIENGFGVFSALNSARVCLVEWETHEYRKKE